MLRHARPIQTRSGRLLVHRTGRGEPLVLLHGLMMSHRVFASLLPALESHFEVIAIDLPGYGQSDIPAVDFDYTLPAFAHAVADALDAMGLTQVRLLGHSLGGGVALTLASLRPDLVAQLVVVCPALYRLPMPPIGRLVLLPKIGRWLWRFGVTLGAVRREMETLHFKHRAAITEALVAQVWQDFNRPGARLAVHATLEKLAQLSDENQHVAKLRSDTLILWGDEDRVVPLAHGKRLKEILPNARFAVIGDCGHNVHLERPSEFMRQLLPFLQTETLKQEAGVN